MELMFVTTIVAILAAVAIPSYNNYVMKNKRAQAKARIVQAAQLLERFYSDSNSYNVDVNAGPPVTLVVNTAGATVAGFAKLMNVPSGTTVYSGSNNETTSPYIITFAAPSTAPVLYLLTATPQGSQTGDTKCMNLTLNNTGVKGVSGTGSVADCW